MYYYYYVLIKALLSPNVFFSLYLMKYIYIYFHNLLSYVTFLVYTKTTVHISGIAAFASDKTFSKQLHNYLENLFP